MSNPDPASIVFSSRYKYFLNKDTEDGSVSIPATSIGAGNAATFTLSIPIDNEDNISQIKINFSHDPTRWHIFPVLDIVLDANSDIAVTGSYSGASLVLTFFVVNQTGGTITSTATNATVRVYLFDTPE